MKIAIYGISCAGKDTFILEVIKRFPDFTHIKGSTRLNEISQKSYGCTFRKIDFQKQKKVREQFIFELKKSDNIIVDGHYCFPENESYRIAFTKSDSELYDIFIYLRALPAVVKERISLSEKNACYTSLSEKDIENWQLKEISEMRDVCFKKEKEFIILDDDFEEDLAFLSEYFKTYPKMNAIRTAERIVEKICKSNPDNRKIALFDCDRTIIEEDTTIPFFELNNGSNKLLKQIFYGDVYTVYQFWRQQKLYKDFLNFPRIENFNKNPQIINKLDDLKNEGYSIYGLTAGIYKIWNDINDRDRIFVEVLGNNLREDSFGIITDFVKGYTVKLLQNKGYVVFSTGDSMCDIYMVETCGGFIWAPGKLRPVIQQYINEHKQTSIKQYRNNPIKYEGIGEAD